MENEETNDSDSDSSDADDIALDGGWGWMVVFGAFVINVITDGCSYSFGVLFTHLVDYFHANRSSTAWVGSVFNASPLLFGPIASIFAKRFGFRKATVVGGLIAAFGMFLSSFVDSLSILCVTYGCISGFGISLPYLASTVVVMMYFKRRRSLATGLAECGAGVGTLIFAPLLQLLISEYGWRGALLILSAIVSNIVLCGALFRPLPKCSAKGKYMTESQQDGMEISDLETTPALQIDTKDEEICDCVIVKNLTRVEYNKTGNLHIGIQDEAHPNLGKSSNFLSKSTKPNEHFPEKDPKRPENKTKHRKWRIVDIKVLLEWRFVIFLISNFILYFWYDVPYVFTVDRALEIGESESRGTLIVSIVGIIHTIGNIVFGFLGDLKRVNRSSLYSASMWVTGLGLAMVPLSRDYLSFAAFDAIYGFFVAASEALSCVLVADILGISKVSDGYGILMFLQGIANLVGPPFAG